MCFEHSTKVSFSSFENFKTNNLSNLSHYRSFFFSEIFFFNKFRSHGRFNELFSQSDLFLPLIKIGFKSFINPILKNFLFDFLGAYIKSRKSQQIFNYGIFN